MTQSHVASTQQAAAKAEKVVVDTRNLDEEVDLLDQHLDFDETMQNRDIFERAFCHDMETAMGVCSGVVAVETLAAGSVRVHFSVTTDCALSRLDDIVSGKRNLVFTTLSNHLGIPVRSYGL